MFLLFQQAGVPTNFKTWRPYSGPGSLVGVATELQTGGFGIESRWGRDFQPIQTCPGGHPASCTTGTGSFSGVEVAGAWGWPPLHLEGRGPRKSRAIPLLTLKAFVAYKKGETYLITIVTHVGSHTVNTMALYFALFWKFCNGGLMVVFVYRNM